MSPRKRGRHTSGKSQLLENGVNTLHALGFHIYDSYPQFRSAIEFGTVVIPKALAEFRGDDTYPTDDE